MSAPVTAATIYHAPDPADFASPVLLDGFTLLYHRPSGQTHMLAEPAPEILTALAEGDADPLEIVKRLARDHGILDSESDVELVIAARMAELAELGLIRPA
jgi:PqqD family protein of HPr-rel-A system